MKPTADMGMTAGSELLAASPECAIPEVRAELEKHGVRSEALSALVRGVLSRLRFPPDDPGARYRIVDTSGAERSDLTIRDLVSELRYMHPNLFRPASQADFEPEPPHITIRNTEASHLVSVGDPTPSIPDSLSSDATGEQDGRDELVAERHQPLLNPHPSSTQHAPLGREPTISKWSAAARSQWLERPWSSVPRQVSVETPQTPMMSRSEELAAALIKPASSTPEIAGSNSAEGALEPDMATGHEPERVHLLQAPVSTAQTPPRVSKPQVLTKIVPQGRAADPVWEGPPRQQQTAPPGFERLYAIAAGSVNALLSGALLILVVLGPGDHILTSTREHVLVHSQARSPTPPDSPSTPRSPAAEAGDPISADPRQTAISSPGDPHAESERPQPPPSAPPASPGEAAASPPTAAAPPPNKLAPAPRSSVPIRAELLQGVPEVIDSATLRLNGVPVRLFGVAPVPGDGSEQLTRLLRGRSLQCTALEVAGLYKCLVGRRDLSQMILFRGAARATADASPEVLAAERLARARKIGVWKR